MVDIHRKLDKLGVYKTVYILYSTQNEEAEAVDLGVKGCYMKRHVEDEAYHHSYGITQLSYLKKAREHFQENLNELTKS